MVKQGYKQTEIGVIPEDWEVKELKEVVELRREKVNPLTSKEVFRCIELENILPNTGRIVGEIYTNEVVSLKTKFFKHDVLFGKLRPYLRKYGLPDFDGVCTSEIWVLYSKLISHNFLYYIIQTDKLIELANQSTGTKMPRAEWSIVSSLKFPLPPLPEQEAIAEALSDADAWIESLEQLIAKKRLIKQGAMQELLTPPSPSSGNADGEALEPWEVKKLGEVCEIFGRIGFRGYTVKDIVSENQGAITLGPSNMRGGKIVGPNYTYISWEKYYESPEIMLAEGDIVLVKTASVGRIALIKDLNIKMTINPQLVVFKNIKCNSVLLSYYMQAEDFQNQIKSKLGGGVLATLTQEEIKQFQVILPSLPEQTRIATILSDMDAELEALEQKLSKARQIKQGMMQELLTGRIRL